MWGSNKGRAWMSLGGVGHVELSEGFFGLTSPTTHLFPLAGQSGSRGVSSMINFELKIWNNSKFYQIIQ